ncbi:CAP domain-containing protein [Streptomyces sp. Go-475]|uniref:CAP domain-containing protein n=1 Tax=Streptomyces sp. Go-475 TaxID=2072505 RepID=UPI0013002701|nr:CAP domain-containing protein [Streptomyces sp. Go-475]
MRRAALALGGALLAWAGPPVPTPPPHYEAPLWPAPRPFQQPQGSWESRESDESREPDGSGPSRKPRDGTAYSRDDTAAQVVAAVNRHRTRAGCGPVRLRASLNRAAQAHSADMARRQRLTHTGADGSGPAARMRAAGYHPRHTAETIAAGVTTPQAAVRTWMDSAPHRDIILTCRYTHAGVGVADGGGGPWWTLDLATGH